VFGADDEEVVVDDNDDVVGVPSREPSGGKLMVTTAGGESPLVDTDVVVAVGIAPAAAGNVTAGGKRLSLLLSVDDVDVVVDVEVDVDAVDDAPAAGGNDNRCPPFAATAVRGDAGPLFELEPLAWPLLPLCGLVDALPPLVGVPVPLAGSNRRGLSTVPLLLPC
jgi:hypothetical protein